MVIQTKSKLYVRRLVRVINALLRAGCAVYSMSYPQNIRVCKVTGGQNSFQNTFKIFVEDCGGRLYSCDLGSFCDGAGRLICASRVA